MTTDRDTLRLIGEWLEDGRTRLPDAVLDAVLAELPSRRQRRRPWMAPWSSAAGRRMPLLPVAAVAVVAIVGLAVLGPVGLGQGLGIPPAALPSPSHTSGPSPSSTASPSSSAAAAPSPAASPRLPALLLPGRNPDAAGDYGWTGRVGGYQAGAHHVEGAGYRAVSFRVGGGCREQIEKQTTRPVRVAGFDAVVVERFEPAVVFGAPRGGEVTEAYAVFVGDRTLCFYLTWTPATTADELASLMRAVETLRAEPIGEDLVRIVFTLDAGWDTG